MSALANLVRISRWQLDEKRQKLADLERLRERMAADVTRLDENLDAERKAAQESDAAMRAFPAFADAEAARRHRLCQSIEEVDRQIDDAREEVSAAYREAKKYELAKENEDVRQRQKRARAEDAAMDEVGLQLHRRKRTGER